jgi:RNA polymerase sigma-70 factor (ECF subfamily)
VTDEKTLIKQLKDKQTKEIAYRTLITLYKERLYWHIRKIVKTHHDADDVLQNTFIKVFQNINNFKENSKLYSWMYRIATNESLTFISKKAKMKNVNIEDYHHYLAESLEADVYYDGDEIQLKLQKVIAKLPQKQQLVFNMKYFDSMKYNDMSEVLETSVGALKASYHHAVKKIEYQLKQTD